MSSAISQCRTCFPGLRPEATMLTLVGRESLSHARGKTRQGGLTRLYSSRWSSTHLSASCCELVTQKVSTGNWKERSRLTIMIHPTIHLTQSIFGRTLIVYLDFSQ